MISIEEALRRVLAGVCRLPSEAVHISDALGRVLAQEVISGDDVPPFDNSAMDGYAVRAVDTVGASITKPAALRVLGTLAAGAVSLWQVESGTAVRIMTGAPIPNGADAVVRFEDTDEADGQGRMASGTSAAVRIRAPAAAGDNVRLAGEDVRRGETVLSEGTLLRPSEIGALAMLGVPIVQAFRRPRVAVLATGDELVPLGEPLTPGKIRNSNEYSVSALVQRYGGVPVRLGIARDTREDLTRLLHEGLRQGADMFLTSAGVSVGQFDVVKDVLAAAGSIEFWQVRMKPGKPLAYGAVRGVPLLGLPGNPVSAMVAFEQFARPAILKMQGHTRLRKPQLEATLDSDVTGGPRREFKRATVESRKDGYHARLTGEQGSGILTSMVRANALLVIREGSGLVKAGERVAAQMLDWPEVE